MAPINGGDPNHLPSLKLTAKAPEHGWLEDEFPFRMAYFQVRTASFREGTKWEDPPSGGVFFQHAVSPTGWRERWKGPRLNGRGG